jgi:hypothetical protein
MNLIRNPVPVQFRMILALRITAHNGAGSGRIKDNSKNTIPPNTNRRPFDTSFMILPPDNSQYKYININIHYWKDSLTLPKPFHPNNFLWKTKGPDLY